MRILTFCSVCAFEDPDAATQLLYVELPEDQIIRGTCARGHDVESLVQSQKWELLLELGAMAYLDGYYREAVSTFAAAYERFLEFYVRTICHAHQIAVENLKKTWSLTSQTERQLGAFCFLYLLTEKTAPPLLSESRVKLRNRVTHQGVFPTKAQALEYLQAVFDFIVKVGGQLRARHNEAADAVISLAVFEARSRAPRPTPDEHGMVRSSTQAPHLLLSWLVLPWGAQTCTDALAELEERRSFYWARSND